MVRKPSVPFLVFIAVFTAIFLLSYLIHLPSDVQYSVFGTRITRTSIYSDFVALYNTIFMDSNSCQKVLASEPVTTPWLNNERYKTYCEGVKIYPIPYVDYYVDAAPLAGSIWFVDTFTAYLLADSLNSLSGLFIAYTVHSIITYLFLLVSYYLLYKIISIKLGKNYIYLFTLLTATLLVYGIYSWEPLAMPFLFYFVYKMLDNAKDSIYSYMFLGLFASFYFLGLTLIVYFLYRFFRGELGGKSIIGLGAGLLPYLIWLIVSPISVSIWYNNLVNNISCNNCVYIFIGNTLDPQGIRALSLGVMALLLVVYYALLSIDRDIVYEAGLILMVSALFNVYFPPQVLLLLQPLMVFLIGRVKETLIYYVTDIANSSIIILWFKDLEIRSYLSFLGIPIQYNPQSLSSPIQWIAQTRNIILIIMLLLFTMRYINKHRNKLRKYIEIP